MVLTLSFKKNLLDLSLGFRTVYIQGWLSFLKLLCTHPHRDTYRVVSWVISNLIKLTMKTGHHKQSLCVPVSVSNSVSVSACL